MTQPFTTRALCAAVLSLAILTLLSGCQAGEPGSADATVSNPGQREDARVEVLRERNATLKRQLASLAPADAYVVVDTARNRLFIKRKGQILLDALASTGSGTILDKPEEPGSQWVFDTPRGEFAIQSRLQDPVWVKPDWAFLEEGEDVPGNPEARIEPGILGEYALGFGKGYFIHGTLYTRLLGKNVTHGCIRLSDDDLRATYRLTRLGTPIMIF